MTLQYIQDHLSYDMIVDGNIKYHGDIDYVTAHMADGHKNVLTISDNQIPALKKFVKDYKIAAKNNPDLSIAQFYDTVFYNN